MNGREEKTTDVPFGWEEIAHRLRIAEDCISRAADQTEKGGCFKYVEQQCQRAIDALVLARGYAETLEKEIPY